MVLKYKADDKLLSHMTSFVRTGNLLVPNNSVGRNLCVTQTEQTM